MDSFASRLLAWFDLHGRHDLPWQRNVTAYSVWISEVMLQQTQVATVIPYYERFIARLPTVRALAAAELDEVLTLWAGLGYYARARNLHRAAKVVLEDHGGELPQTLDALMTLPGVGRSTAGAILALSQDQRLPILDGNVKRVLARYHAIEDWPGEPRVARELWSLAERHTPSRRVADYTQAIMDLGATLCTQARPACTVCPLNDDCSACSRGIQARLPAPRPRRARPRRRVVVLVLRDRDGNVLLERRPAHGIWGGLFSLPEIAEQDGAEEWCARKLGAKARSTRSLAPIAHTFTHFDLDIEPRLVDLAGDASAILDRTDWLWYNPRSAAQVGMPAPVATLLGSLVLASEQGDSASPKRMRRRIA